MLGLRLIKQRCEEEIRGDKKRYGFSQLLGIQLIFEVSGEVVSKLYIIYSFFGVKSYTWNSAVQDGFLIFI